MDGNKQAFNEFIDVLKEVTNNDTEVIKLIEKRYLKANPHYTSSAQFLHLLQTVQRKVRHDSVNKYIFVKELCDELKAYDVKHSKSVKHKSLLAGTDSDSADSAKSVKNNGASSSKNRLSLSLKRRRDSDTPTNLPESKKAKPNDKQVNEGGSSSQRDEVEEIELIDFKKTSNDNTDVNVIEIESLSDATETVKDNGNIAPAGGEESEEDDRDILEIMEDDSDDAHNDSQQKDKEPAPSTSSGKSQDATPDIDPSIPPGTARKIAKYQHFLKRLEKKIKSLEEKEVSVDELEDDYTYLTIDKLKQTFVKHWERMCKLQSRNTSTGRPIERKFKCKATRYPKINRHIQKLINKKKVFPDYHNILFIVKECNVRYNLGMNKRLIDMVSRDAFTEVGNQLQQRRREDYDCAFGSHLTDAVRDYDDPALYDIELRRKLESNQKQSKTKLDELIKKFAYKQETEGDKSDEENDDDEDEDNIIKEEEEKLLEDQNSGNAAIDHQNVEAGHVSDSDVGPEGSNVSSSSTIQKPETAKTLDGDENLPVTKESDEDEREIVKISGVLSENIRSNKDIRQKKHIAKRSLHAGPNTISLKDVLGGSTLSKEHVNKDAEDKLVETENVDENKADEKDASETDDDGVVQVVDDDEITTYIVMRKKPVSSPRAREGLLNLKQLKQPDSLLGHLRKEQGDTAAKNVPNVLSTISSAIEVSSEEDSVINGPDDIPPFRENKEAASVSNSRVLEQAEPQGSHHSDRKHASVAYRRIVPSTIVSYTNKSVACERSSSEVMDLSGGKQEDCHNQPHTVAPKGQSNGNGSPITHNSSVVQCDFKQSNSPDQQPTNNQQSINAAHKPVDEPVVITDDDELQSPEIVVDIVSPTPSVQSSHHPMKQTNKATNGTAELETTNYTYKKVVTEKTVSSSSTPQKETVVRSSTKTVIKKTPMNPSSTSTPTFYKSTTEEKTTVGPGTSNDVLGHYSGGQGTSGHSALSGFRLTRRKTKKSNDVNYTHTNNSFISEDMRREVHKIVNKVLEDHPRPQSPVDEPVIIDIDTESLSGKGQVSGRKKDPRNLPLYDNSSQQLVVTNKITFSRPTGGESHGTHQSVQGNAQFKQHPNVPNRSPANRLPLATLSELAVRQSPRPKPQNQTESVIILSDSD